jgi:FdhD protein
VLRGANRAGRRGRRTLKPLVPATVIHWRLLDGRPQGREPQGRQLIAEEPLTMEVVGAGAGGYTIMRTPGHDRELVVGFLFSEGMIRGATEVKALVECPENPNLISVRLAGGEVPGTGPAPVRSLPVGSACGLCGRAGVEELVAGLPAVKADFKVPVDVFGGLPLLLRARQEIFQATGAGHAAALFDAEGRLLVLREDLGRHNAFDKILGHALLTGMATADKGVLLSGRVSLEMVAKAARAGIPVVAAISAATAAAVEAAERLGICLCGFVRGDEVTVYTHPERIEP